MTKWLFLPTIAVILLAGCSPVTSNPEAKATSQLETPKASPSPAGAPPEPTPTIFISPTPPPRFFTEEFGVEPAYWTRLVTNGEGVPQASVEKNLLNMTLAEPYTWVYQLFEPYEYADVRVDALFEPRGSEPSATGVICRYSEESGWYEFNISRDGTYNILLGQWLMGGIAQYVPILYDESEYIKPELAAFEIGLACQGDILWLYINGKLIRKVDVERFGLFKGKIGLAAASFENTPVISVFDWIKVSEP